MTSQKYLPSLDPSSIIWNKEDYLQNKLEYREILLSLTKLMDEMENFSFLISKELQEEMSCSFPANSIEGGGDLWAIIFQLYDFLSKVGSRTVRYNKLIDKELSSVPNQLKEHFNEVTKREIQYLLNHYHTEDGNKSKVYFSFERFWNDTNVLITKSKSQETHTSIIIDRGTLFDDFIDNFYLRFEHKAKHDISVHRNRDAWAKRNPEEEFISQLSCLENNGSQTPQEILDKRFDKSFGNNCYFGYDTNKRVYVVFRISGIGTNIYHAHDEYDINKIPKEVKESFRIFKYD